MGYKNHEYVKEEIICLSGNNTSEYSKAKAIVKQFNNLFITDKNFETTAFIYDISRNKDYDDIKKSLKHVFFIQLESLVRSLFGIDAVRIIKYLGDGGARELKKIAEVCKICSNQALKLLHQLMKKKIVRMLDINHKIDLNYPGIITMWKINLDYLKNHVKLKTIIISLYVM